MVLFRFPGGGGAGGLHQRTSSGARSKGIFFLRFQGGLVSKRKLLWIRDHFMRLQEKTSLCLCSRNSSQRFVAPRAGIPVSSTDLLSPSTLHQTVPLLRMFSCGGPGLFRRNFQPRGWAGSRLPHISRIGPFVRVLPTKTSFGFVPPDDSIQLYPEPWGGGGDCPAVLLKLRLANLPDPPWLSPGA